MAAIEKSMAKAFGLDGEPGGPRQPVERLHRDPGRGGPRRGDLDLRMARLAVPRPRRCGLPVARDQPQGVHTFATVDQWASKAVLGERFCANHKEVPVPPQHRAGPNILTAINGLGLPFIGSVRAPSSPRTWRTFGRSASALRADHAGCPVGEIGRVAERDGEVGWERRR
jgi:hypothetical protein